MTSSVTRRDALKFAIGRDGNLECKKCGAAAIIRSIFRRGSKIKDKLIYICPKCKR